MKKIVKTVVAPLSIFVLLVGTAHAGDWAVGWGETLENALKNAHSNAAAAVKSRGTGCLTGITRDPEKVGNLWKAQEFYAHHNGGCGKRSNDQKFLEDILKRFL